jgi:hypothetical protein
MFAVVTGFVLTAPHVAQDLASTTVRADGPALQSGLPADGATPPWASSSAGTGNVLTGGVAGGSLTAGGVSQGGTGVPPVVTRGGPLAAGGTARPVRRGDTATSRSLTLRAGVPQVSTGVPPVVAGLGPVTTAGGPVVAPRSGTTQAPAGSTTSPSQAPSTGSPSPSKQASPTATPTPTAKSTPSPTASSRPVAIGGWPNASNTGVPSVVTLTPSGPLVITQAGQTITGLDVKGCVTVDAPNVTITNSRITCSAMSTVKIGANGSLRMVSSEINGLGGSAACISYSNFTLIDVNIHDCVDGIKLTFNDVIENSYVHDLSRGATTHNDAIQTLGGGDSVVRGNTLQAYRAATDDPMNAAIQTGHLNRALANVIVDHNYMDGGNYTVNAGATSTDGWPISGYVFTNNVFGPDYRYGAVDELGAGISFDSSNVWASTGLPVH